MLRVSPASDALRQAFTRTEKRTQRQSDGTLTIEARRFEVPNRYRHLRSLAVRYAQWDLSYVYLIDERSGEIVCRLYPQDKQANARAVRRPLEPLANSTGVRAAVDSAPATALGGAAMAPLLEKLIAQQSASGLPPAYLPKDEPLEQA